MLNSQSDDERKKNTEHVALCGSLFDLLLNRLQRCDKHYTHEMFKPDRKCKYNCGTTKVKYIM